MDHRNMELKKQITDLIDQSKVNNIEFQKVKVAEQQSRCEIDKLNSAIGEIMEEAAVKTRQEVDSLKKLYNSNLEKLISECSMLEIVRLTFSFNVIECVCLLIKYI